MGGVWGEARARAMAEESAKATEAATAKESDAKLVWGSVRSWGQAWVCHLVFVSTQRKARARAGQRAKKLAGCLAAEKVMGWVE